MRKRRLDIRVLPALVMLTAILASTPAPAAAYDEKRHQAAVADARAGNHDAALSVLGPMAAEPGAPDTVRYDHVVVLAWAGHYDRAIEAAGRIDMDTAPRYVLETVAWAARHVDRYKLAVHLYRKAIARFPDTPTAPVELALTLADSGDTDGAIQTLTPLLNARPDDVKILFASAYVAEAAGNHTGALAAYQKILDLDPGNREALRRLILTANTLGAHHLAADMAARHPGLLTPEETALVEGDRAAITLRWGWMWPESPEARFEETDRALALLNRNVARAHEAGDTKAELRARFDRMVALRDRLRMADVVAEYRALTTEGVDIPPHALVATGDAFWQLGKPAAARDLYLRAQGRVDDPFELQVKLIYAWLDLGDFNSAFAAVDQLVADQPETLSADGGRIREPNPRRMEAEVLAAVARAFADRLDEAQERLEALHAAAPGNRDVRAELANVYLWRGWPHRALAAYELALADDPDHPPFRQGRARALMDLHRRKEAARAVNELITRYPEDARVRRIAREWQTGNLRQWTLSANRWHSSGTAEGSDGTEAESFLYSSRFSRYYRAFLHGLVSSADFSAGTETLSRLGLGAEYSNRGIRLTAEAHGDRNGGSHSGVALTVDVAVNDHLELSAGFDSFSRDTPLQALQADVDARAFSAGATVTPHETRAFHLGYTDLDFSDGNRRRSAFASWSERWVTGASYRLTTDLTAYTSNNSLAGAPYFNPDRDASVNLAADNAWHLRRKLFRRYARAFVHGVTVSAGRYRQQGFSDETTWGARYYHRWEVSDRLEIGYGVGHSRPVYDGATEKVTAADLSVNWRF